MLLKIRVGVLTLVCGVVLLVFATEENIILELHRSRRQTAFTQDEENSLCQLPPAQPNGLFLPSQRRCPPENNIIECQMIPGNPVPHFWVLFNSCDSGYILNDTAITASVCLNGYWIPGLPHCVKLCPELPRELSGKNIVTVEKKCLFRGKEISCDSNMRPGTVAMAECPQFYRTNFEKMCLDNGTWTMQNRSYQLMDSDIDDHFRCVPDCGISPKPEITSEYSTISTISRPVKPGYLPWVAEIYHNKNGSQWNMCQGTLITNHIVITARSCLLSDRNIMIEPGYTRVGLGKVYRSFYKRENSKIIYEVERIHSSNYSNNYKGIALLSLLVEVHVCAFIMPVCIDWGDNSIPETGAIVELPGWVDFDGPLRSTQMTFIERKVCQSRAGLDDQSLAMDKFCIENPSRYFWTDDGTGIAFKKERRNFLTGIITPVAVRSNNDYLKNHQIIFSTNIKFQTHADWLKDTILGVIQEMRSKINSYDY